MCSIMRNVQNASRLVFATFAAAFFCVAQTAPAVLAGGIAGRALDERGQPVNGTVVVVSHGQIFKAQTNSNGAFSFSDLHTGTYVICLRPAAFNPKADHEPLVDSCAWQDKNSQLIRLAPGQDTTDIIVRAVHGYAFGVHVNDPFHLLSPSLGGKLASNDISIVIAAPSGQPRHLPIVNEDASGRDHQIVIPYDTPHKLYLQSPKVDLLDLNGKKIDPTTPININGTSGVSAPSLVVSISGLKSN
jgi:Carboxypeptidase regulatory-like domain